MAIVVEFNKSLNEPVLLNEPKHVNLSEVVTELMNESLITVGLLIIQKPTGC